jgi:hypothetical protein
MKLLAEIATYIGGYFQLAGRLPEIRRWSISHDIVAVLEQEKTEGTVRNNSVLSVSSC